LFYFSAASAKRAKTALGLPGVLVTDAEIGQQVASMISESLAVLPGAPAGAIPAVVAAHGVALNAFAGVPAALAALAGVPAALAALAGVPAALAANNAALAANTAALAALAEKFSNSLAVEDADVLTPVPNAQGAVPGIFPATRGAFHTLTAANCNTLFLYYGVPVPPAGTAVSLRRALLRPLLGLTRAHNN